MVRNDTPTATAPMERQHPYSEGAASFTARLFQPLLRRRRWSALERLRDLRKERERFCPPVNLGVLSGERTFNDVFDGDITIESIGSHCQVTLESRQGSITISHN